MAGGPYVETYKCMRILTIQGENLLGKIGLFPMSYTTYKKPPTAMASNNGRTPSSGTSTASSTLPTISHTKQGSATMEDTMFHIDAAINSLSLPPKSPSVLSLGKSDTTSIRPKSYLDRPHSEEGRVSPQRMDTGYTDADDLMSIADVDDVIAGKGLIPPTTAGGRSIRSFDSDFPSSPAWKTSNVVSPGQSALNAKSLGLLNSQQRRMSADDRSIASQSEYSVETEYTRAGDDDGPGVLTSDVPLPDTSLISRYTGQPQAQVRRDSSSKQEQTRRDSSNQGLMSTQRGPFNVSPSRTPQMESPKPMAASLPSTPPLASVSPKVPSPNPQSAEAIPSDGLPADPKTWTTAQVSIWLHKEGFENLVDNFVDNEITGDILLELDLVSLKEIDIKSFGKRFHVMNAIHALKKKSVEVAASGAPAVSQVTSDTNGASRQDDNVAPHRSPNSHRRNLSIISTKSQQNNSTASNTPKTGMESPKSAASTYLVGPGGEMLPMSPETPPGPSPNGVSEAFRSIREQTSSPFSTTSSRRPGHYRSNSDGPDAMRRQSFHEQSEEEEELQTQREEKIRQQMARSASQQPPSDDEYEELVKKPEPVAENDEDMEDLLHQRLANAQIRQDSIDTGNGTGTDDDFHDARDQDSASENQDLIVTTGRLPFTSSTASQGGESTGTGTARASSPELIGERHRRSNSRHSDITTSTKTVEAGAARSPRIVEDTESDDEDKAAPTRSAVDAANPRMMVSEATAAFVKQQQEEMRRRTAKAAAAASTKEEIGALTVPRRARNTGALQSPSRLSTFEGSVMLDEDNHERDVMSDGETPTSFEAKTNRRRQKFLRNFLGSDKDKGEKEKKKELVKEAEKKSKQATGGWTFMSEQEKKQVEAASAETTPVVSPAATSPSQVSPTGSDSQRFGSFRRMLPGAGKRDSRRASKLDKPVRTSVFGSSASVGTRPTIKHFNDSLPEEDENEQEVVQDDLTPTESSRYGSLTKRSDSQRSNMSGGVSLNTNGVYTPGTSTTGTKVISPTAKSPARLSPRNSISTRSSGKTAEDPRRSESPSLSSQTRTVATTVVTPSMRGGALAQIGEPDHEGWLRKRGEKYNIWKTRYIILKGVHLYFLKSERETKIKGFVNLAGYKIIADDLASPTKVSSMMMPGGNGGKYGFKIIHDTERAHHFATDEADVAREWIKAMMKATIGRDLNAPVISSCNIPTVPLHVAQRSKPRPPSLLGIGQLQSQNKLPRVEPGNGITEIPIKTKLHFTGILSKWTPAQYVEWIRNHVGDEEIDLSLSLPERKGGIRDSQSTGSSGFGALDDKAVSQVLTGPLMRNGLILIRLVEGLSGQTIGKNIPEATYTLQMLENLIMGFKFLGKVGVSTEGVTVKDVYNGDRDRIFELLDHIRRRFPAESGGQMQEA